MPFGEWMMKFWIKMAAGLVLGIIVGSYIGAGSLFLEPLRIVGLLFFRVLNFLVFPLLLLSTIRSILYLKSQKRLFLSLVKTVGFHLLLTAVGAAVGIVLGDVLRPGAGINIEEFESPVVLQYPFTTQYILDMVPESIFGFLKSGYAVLALLFISFLIAVGIILAKEESEEFHTLVISIDKTFHRLNLMVLEFLPIGIFTYIGYTLGFMTAGEIMPYLKLVLIITAGSFIQIFIVQAMLVFIFTKTNPFKFIHAVVPACMVGYVSGNRYTSYPVLVEVMEHNLGADPEVFTFLAGVGTVLGLSGSALAAGVSTLFVAQVYGLDLSIYLQIIIVLLITVSTLKLDGMNNGSIVILSVILAYVVKLPAEGYALILGISSIVFRIETVVNVTGNAAVSYICSYSEKGISNVRLKDFL
jgi:Na+/H+-dicarboxylate symporter